MMMHDEVVQALSKPLTTPLHYMHSHTRAQAYKQKHKHGSTHTKASVHPAAPPPSFHPSFHTYTTSSRLPQHDHARGTNFPAAMCDEQVINNKEENDEKFVASPW